FHGPGRAAWEEVPDPGLRDATDAVVRVTAVTVCGTDLHILRGDVPEVPPGTVLGHEAVGEVVEAGSAVTAVRPGDRVLVSCISSCGRCPSCRQGPSGQCRGGGGWIRGHTVDGPRTAHARGPGAAPPRRPLPGSMADRDAVLLAAIAPTAYEVGVLNGGVRPGDTVVVVGAGPVGLAAVATARFFAPERIIAVDLAASRLEAARNLGADA